MKKLAIFKELIGIEFDLLDLSNKLEKNSIKLYSYGKRFSKVLFKELEELEND